MKSVLKQSGKAICYIALFLGMQLLTGILFSFGYGIIAGVNSGLSGEILDQVTVAQMAEEALRRNQVMLALVSDVLCVLFLMVFFGIRKKKWYREANINRIYFKDIPYFVTMGLGTALLINGVLNLMPDSLLEDYMEASGVLTQDTTVFTVLLGVIIGPIVEEIIFRGIILNRLRKAMPVTAAVLVSSFLFGVAHIQPIWAIYTFVLGCILAIAAVRTDSIVPSIIIHVIFNACGELLAASNIEGTMIIGILFAFMGCILMAGTAMIYIKNQQKSEHGGEENGSDRDRCA